MPKDPYKSIKEIARILLVKNGIQLLNYLWKSWSICETKETRTDIKTIREKYGLSKTKAYHIIRTLRKWNIVDYFTRIDEDTGNNIKLYYIVSDIGNKLMTTINSISGIFPKPPMRFSKAPIQMKYKKVEDLPIDISFE